MSADLESLKQVDCFEISKYLDGTAFQDLRPLSECSAILGAEIGKIPEFKEPNWEIRLGKKNAGIKINYDNDKKLISVAIMRSKRFCVSYHVIYGAEKVQLSTNLVTRGKTKQLVKDVTFINKKGGITITKEGKKYYVLSFINKKIDEQPNAVEKTHCKNASLS